MFVLETKMFELCVYYCRVYVCTKVAVQLNRYVQCGKHICSVIYVKCVYSVHCHVIDCSDFSMTYICLYTFHISLADI